MHLFFKGRKYTELGPQTTTYRYGFLSCATFVRFMGFRWGIHGGFARECSSEFVVDFSECVGAG